jgi:hypothetical protein
MKCFKGVVKTRLASVSVLALVALLAPAWAMAQIPTIDAPHQSDVDAETHFLTFLGSFVPESPASATAYYNAIDPTASKRTFTKWLVNAGFIGQEADWRSTGAQNILIQPGCSGTHTCTYGPNVVVADAHVIVLNAADLGFVRNQFIRCVPSCTAANPKIYTYLENYPVDAFAQHGSGFPSASGVPTQAEATAAITSAISRPVGVLPGTNPPLRVDRIADVAFEWAPPANNPTSTTRFGQQYAFLFFRDCSAFATSGDPTGVHSTQCIAGGGTISETINWSSAAVAAQNSRLANQNPSQFPPLCSNASGSGACPINVNQPFAPELDGRGAKVMPGVCLVCHGGKPQNLTSLGTYPRGGNIGGFRFLPLDNANLMFATPESDSNSRTSQQSNIKSYNQAVLLTVSQQLESDDQGVRRLPHLAEVIKGWYAPNMTATAQNEQFVPAGWGGDPNSTLGKFYLETVGPNCRTCHFNRELSLDFGTVGAFDQESDLLQLALLVECSSFKPNDYSPDPKLRPMPLAHLTWQRFWQNVNNTINPSPNPTMVQQLKDHFGFITPGAYCATNP